MYLQILYHTPSLFGNRRQRPLPPCRGEKPQKMLLFSSFVLTNKEALYIMLSDFRSDNQIPLSRVAEGTAR